MLETLLIHFLIHGLESRVEILFHNGCWVSPPDSDRDRTRLGTGSTVVIGLASVRWMFFRRLPVRELRNKK